MMGNRKRMRRRVCRLERLERRDLLAASIWWSAADAGDDASLTLQAEIAEGEAAVHTTALPPGDRSPAIVTARANEFFAAHRHALGLGDPSFNMYRKVVIPDWLDMDHVRYQQTYQRVPVFGGELIVHLNGDGDVRVVNGRVVPEIDLDPTPQLSPQQAVELAVEAFRTSPPGGPVLDAWSPCGVAAAEACEAGACAAEACGTVDCGAGCGSCEPQAGDVADRGDRQPQVLDVSLQVLGMGLLDGGADGPNYLTWVVELEDFGTMSHERYFVDAHSGETRLVLDEVRMSSPNSARPAFVGLSLAEPEGEDERHQIYRKTYDCSLVHIDDPATGTGCWSNLFWNDRRWGRIEGAPPAEPNPYKPESPNDVNILYEYSLEIDRYFYEKFGRPGLNWKGGMGDGTSARPFHHMRGRAHLEGTNPTPGCAGASFTHNTVNFPTANVLPDIVGHEFAHAITYYHHWDANDRLQRMVYSGLSATLQESYSDFTGEMFEYWLTGENDWIMGAEHPCGGYRNLADPPAMRSGQVYADGRAPDRYYHNYFPCSFGAYHEQANVPNKGMYLATMGGEFNGCTIQGIGREKMEQVLYRAVTQYYTLNETFNGAFHANVQACQDLIGQFGITAQDCVQVTRALRAVEMDQPGRCVDPTGAQRVAPCAPPTEIVGRHVFYNDSAFDGDDPAINSLDQQAIAPDKSALLPGELAGSQHYTSYHRGLNGLMIDVSQPIEVTAADFEFRVGNGDDLAAWTAAPEPLDLHFDADALRITITWADGAIRNQWLEVRMKANDNTHLVVDDVFYFGNAVGETGDVPGDTLVDAYDVAGTAANPRDADDPAPITDPYDFNRDARVDATDIALAQQYATDPDTRLRLLDLRPAGLPQVSVDVAPDSVSQTGDQPLVFTFTRSEPIEEPATVTFRVTGSARFPDDYQVSGAASFTEQVGSVFFDAGSDSAEVLVHPAIEANLADDGTVWLLVLAGEDYAVGAAEHAVGTIVEDQAYELAIDSVSGPETDEQTTAFVFTVTLSAPAAVPVTVDYATADGTATVDDGDYQAASGTLTFAPGELSQTVTVLVYGDTKVEDDETFYVRLSNARLDGQQDARLTIAVAEGVGTIVNDDRADFTIDSVSEPEGDSGTTELVFTVRLSAAVAFETSVDYATADGTATVADGDYQAASGTLTFAAGQTEKTVTVLVHGDTQVEDDETFSVQLADARLDGQQDARLTIAVAEGVGTILNDDAAVVSIGPAELALPEGDEGLTPFEFTVTLSAPVALPVTVLVDTVDGTATLADGDYQALDGQVLTFLPGQPLQQTVTVQVVGDTRAELDETFFVQLSDVLWDGSPDERVSLGEHRATGLILNDDPWLTGLAASPDPVIQGAWITLTAELGEDADRVVDQVSFYRQDQYLGSVPSEDGDRSLSVATTDWQLGLHHFSAVAIAADGSRSDAVGVTASVYAEHPPMFLGAVPIYARKEEPFTVDNSGSGTITVLADGWGEVFAIRPADDTNGDQAWQVAAGTSRDYLVAFAPVEDGEVDVLLTLAGDDGTGSVMWISGLGVAGWQNPLDQHDVNWDGDVTPQDVLLLINELNRGASGPLSARTADEPGPALFLDVSGSGTLVPYDVLQVINHLNRAASGQGATNGEGEAADGWGLPDWQSLLDEPLVNLSGHDAFFRELAG